MVRLRRRARWPLVSVAAVALLVGLTVPAGGAHSMGGVKVVADHLDNPRGLEIAHGALYVAEAGSGGDLCLPPDQATCVGLTSSITRVSRHGHQRRVVRGLLSAAGPDGSFATGVDDVSIARRGGGLFMIVTAAGCEIPPGLPPEIVRQHGKLLRAKHHGVRVVADITAFECANNPDGDVLESNPYSVLALSNRRQVVADAAGNSILKVRNGRVSLLAVIPDSPNGTDQVPTSVTLGPDGAYYVGTLAEGAGNGGANVWRIVPGEEPEVFVGGLTAVVDLAFGPDGSLYVCEFSTDIATFNPAGAVVRIRPDGRRTVLGAGSLFFPGGVAVSRKGEVYVSNWSVLPANGAAGFPPDARGQVVRLRR